MNDVPSTARRAGPFALAIFGASGDLTRRKLIPALYNLGRQQLLPDDFAILGLARREGDTQAFREQMREAVASYAGSDFDPGLWDRIESQLHYLRGDITEPQIYAELGRTLPETGVPGGNVLFYLATSPEQFAPVVRQLHEAGLTRNAAGGWRRVVVEKPFGHDMESARSLNEELRAVLDERQIYRIDHYLGKETVQNLLVLRFSNGMFEPIWNRRYVNHVQITVAETLGVEARGGYYDHAGALRDMVPNHIFQLISLVAMEPPISFEADAVRDEQVKVLRAIPTLTPEQVLQRAVRGQYGAGRAGGKDLPDYRAEDRVDPASHTETFVAMQLEIDNWRWKDVPFYLRVGKAMPRRTSEITVSFRRPPFALFRDTPVTNLAPNELVINVQPDEGIALHFGVKVPGAAMCIGGVNMEFCYSEHFGKEPATGYERLLYDAVLGDPTLFRRADMVESGWRIVTPVLDVWEALAPRSFPNYAAGTWGPAEAEELLARDGRQWRTIEG